MILPIAPSSGLSSYFMTNTCKTRLPCRFLSLHDSSYWWLTSQPCSVHFQRWIWYRKPKQTNHPHSFTAVCGYVKSFLHSSNSVIGLKKKKITTQKHWCTSERFINLLRVYKARWFTHWEACGCSGLMQAPSDGAGSGCIYASASHQACFNWPLEATCLASTLIIAANTS